jgi:hypothetical protein
MLILFVACAALAEEPGPALPVNYCYPVTNPTELLEGNLLSKSDEFGRFLLHCHYSVSDSGRTNNESMSDRFISLELVKRLSKAKKLGLLKGFNVELNVIEGTTWLSGRVSTAEQKQFVLRLAQTIRGVRQVVDDLTVSDKPEPTEAAQFYKELWK